jgi:hypothetical protein
MAGTPSSKSADADFLQPEPRYLRLLVTLGTQMYLRLSTPTKATNVVSSSLVEGVGHEYFY